MSLFPPPRHQSVPRESREKKVKRSPSVPSVIISRSPREEPAAYPLALLSSPPTFNPASRPRTRTAACGSDPSYHSGVEINQTTTFDVFQTHQTQNETLFLLPIGPPGFFLTYHITPLTEKIFFGEWPEIFGLFVERPNSTLEDALLFREDLMVACPSFRALYVRVSSVISLPSNPRSFFPVGHITRGACGLRRVSHNIAASTSTNPI